MARKVSDLERAEAMGSLTTLPFDETLPDADSNEVADVPDTPVEFQFAIGHAQMEGNESIEVTPKLYEYLVRKAKSKYITYGDPGIKVFKFGTREDIEREESMSAEQYYEVQMKRKAAERGNK